MISLNTTAIVLYVVGSIIFTGSNIWILSTDNLSDSNIITITSTNLCATVSMSLGVILSQIEICTQNVKLNRLRVNEQTEDII